ncbi:hypothetical protein Pcinc_029068 [Petrolisthes cinctipes]|uniref:Uncharacterized protein n=1 Tax=Petrolisthes cinctipes TaxID=88211 RepID=A0AAE1F137_PETCI|nr:hypothetical protein Pcinc_029068 [Petrolisthes cinctipes]
MTLKQALNPPPNYVNSRLRTGSVTSVLLLGHTHTHKARCGVNLHTWSQPSSCHVPSTRLHHTAPHRTSLYHTPVTARPNIDERLTPAHRLSPHNHTIRLEAVNEIKVPFPKYNPVPFLGSHYDPDALEALHTTTALLALTLSPNQLSYINSSDLPQPITTFLPSNNQSPVFLLTCSLYNQSDTPYHPALGSHLS